ncbi:MAG TPA: trehalase family glycosidase, partial [Opitutales bacterium]|nr:trehalase family glycosidase [Opitutales bacterium]
AEIRPASVLPVRNATVENGTIRIGRHGFVLVDFFHLEMGKVSFRAKGSGQLTVSVGESPEEAMNDNRNAFEQYPIEPFELDGGASRIESPERALRYVKIYSENGCELTDVKFTAKIWPVNFLMSFECSDERINAIWHASVATLLTSTHGFYLDGIKRDYLPWSMDAVVSNFGGDYVFGQKQVALNGLSVSMLPLNPNRKDFGIPDYPLHALIGFRQLYQRYHDFETILAYRDRIRQLMALYASIQDSRGFVSSKAAGGRGFTPGWSTLQGPDRQGIPAYAQIMLYWNFMIAAEFAEKWGDPKEAEGYRNRAESLKAKIMEYFWDDDQGLFLNGYNRDGEFDSRISHHAQYWAVLAGIFPEERQDAMFSRLAEIPHYRGNVSFEKGYEFLAYSKARKVREMWDFLFDVFGDWLDQGHTRFPENFSYQSPRSEQLVFYKRPYGLSLCHGANGVPGIVAVLHGIAGFSQNPEKLNHYTLQPDWMDLQWARVEFPVKEGKIRMALVDRKHVEVEIPDGCVVEYVDQQGKRTKLSGKDTSYLQTGLD